MPQSTGAVKPQFTFLHYACIETISILAYAIPSKYRKLGFLTLAIPVFYVFAFMKTSGVAPVPLGDIGVGTRLVSLVLYASTDFLLHDAQKEYRPTSNNEDISKKPFLSRLWWAFQVWGNPRGVGWTQEVKGLPPKPRETFRLRFIGSLLVNLAFALVAHEVNWAIIRRNPYFKQSQHVEGWEWLWRIGTVGYGLNVLIQMQVHAAILAIICLFLGFTEPKDWPPHYRSITDAYTVSRTWSKVWHSLFKRANPNDIQIHLEHAYFFDQKLRAPGERNSTANRIILLTIAFSITGLMHLAGDFAMLEDWTASTGALIFFLLQAPAIIFEHAIIGLARQAGFTQPTLVTRVIGYIWVCCWFAFSLPFWMDLHIRNGAWEASPQHGMLLAVWQGLKGSS